MTPAPPDDAAARSPEPEGTGAAALSRRLTGQSDDDWDFLERGFRTLRNTKAAADAWTRAVAQGFSTQAPHAAATVFVVKTLAGLEERLGAEVVALWDADAAPLNGKRVLLTSAR